MASDRDAPRSGVWSRPVNRTTYLWAGIALALLKYAVDAVLIWNATGQAWTPASYIHSAALGMNTEGFSWRHMTPAGWLLPVLFIWALPFVWLGVTLTARRALDAGWSEWTCLLFFVPYVNYGVMLLLCLVPTRARVDTASLDLGLDAPAPESTGRRLPHVFLAATAGMTVGLVTVWFAVVLLRTYGAALFIGAPFVMGAVTAFIVNRREVTTRSGTNGAVLLALMLAGFALLAVAMEGVVCIVMAMPLAVPLALLGGIVGRGIAEEPRPRRRPGLLMVLALPLWVALEPPDSTGRLPHEVYSSIEIAAPPLAVWSHVVAFEPLPAPQELMFRVGVAFPVRARIDGAGVGAVRYCEFSTGAFVEPITRWEPGVTLAFDVSASPPPMTEWSPYRNVHPPHLDGFLRARRGEFRLVPLDGGRTRLEGRTWYEIDMAPEGYWQMWTDFLIHRIHMRVLDQIKRESEGSAGHGSKIAGH